MNFDEWWEMYAKRAQLAQMDEAICDVCKQAAQAAWGHKIPGRSGTWVS